MRDAVVALEREVGALVGVWAGALPAGSRVRTAGSGGADTRWEASSMSNAGVLRVLGELAAVQRAVDALRVAVAGEVVTRTRCPREGSEGLARAQGHRDAVSLVAAAWQVTVAEAARACRVGDLTRSPFEHPGQCSAEFPAVADAVDRGVLGLTVSATIIRNLIEASPRCVRQDRDVAERALVEVAGAFTAAEVEILARETRNRIDADGPVPSERQRRSRRAWRMTALPDNVTRVVWEMPADTAGLVKAGIDAVVGEQLRRTRSPDGGVRFREARETANALGHTLDECPDLARCEDQHLPDGAGTGGGAAAEDSLLGADERTLPQLRSDAAEQIFRHAATCGSPGGDLPAISMVIRMDHRDLLTGLGMAQIDGIEAELPAEAARQLAGEAEIIPMVLAGTGEVLDVGRARRLFSRAQKIAIADRDGGCGFGGCPAPPSYTEAHHILWWSQNGPTDLDNGILLCSFHHHLVHNNGWRIEIRDDGPWFLPPPWLAPTRRPHRAGRPRIALGTDRTHRNNRNSPPTTEPTDTPPSSTPPSSTPPTDTGPRRRRRRLVRKRPHHLDPENWIPEDLVHDDTHT